MSAPMKIDLPYLSPEKDRHGNERLYVRRFGRRLRVRAEPGTEAFLTAYRAALGELSGREPAELPPAAPEPPRGSLAWLGALYFKSDEFLALDAVSQATRTNILKECFLEPHTEADPEPIGNCPIRYLTAAKVRRLRDLKKGKPGAANNRRKYLSAMFGWAVENGHMTANPARDVRRVRYASEGFHTWSVEEVVKFCERHPVGTKARLALALLLFLGVRRGDVVRLGRQMQRTEPVMIDGKPVPTLGLRFVPNKTRWKRRDETFKPMLPVLATVIAAGPCGALTFLETEYGAPFTAAGFGNWFADRCREAKVPGRAHGLRKAGATILADLGATVHELMAIYDWHTIAQAQKYIEAVNRKRLAATTLPLLGRVAS